jgi:hypothetical protein
MNNAFMQLPAMHGCQLCLHGHIYEAIHGFQLLIDNLIIIDKNFLFRAGSIGGLLLACQGIFCIVLHRKPVAGDAIW